MAKITQPIKEVWDEIKKDKNTPIELIQKDDGTGVVRVKKLRIK